MAEDRWYKGNIHTHTTESDGDADPHKVVSWYRRHGYDFLVLSDHNHLTILDYSSRRRFKRPVMIPGEELSPPLVHLNGIGISRVIEPIETSDVVTTLQANINAILQAGGIASLNHPNAGWAFDHTHINQLSGASLLEVFNGWPGASGEGALDKPSYEEIWDGVLSAGRPIFGVATDDAHHYSDFSYLRANPGRGWLMVHALELTSDAIVEAMASGAFYPSTGVTLTGLQLAQDRISFGIEQEHSCIYATRFIGRNGRLLAESAGNEAEYRPRGNEGYVRATISSSSGAKAWTQPVFLR